MKNNTGPTFTNYMANEILSAHCDLIDVRNVLSDRIKNRPKDNEGTECTIGMCLDAAIETIGQLCDMIEEDTRDQ